MDCERYRDAKVLRLYGETEDDAPDLDAHLAACAACRDEMDEMDEVSILYREASAEPMPLRLRERALRGPQPRARWLSFAAAGIAAAVLLGLLLRTEPEESALTVSWRDVDFSGLRIVLEVTQAEWAEVGRFRSYQPWDRTSFAGGRLEWISFRLDELDRSPIWIRKGKS